MYLICQVASRDHLIEKACEFMGGNSLPYLTTLVSLVTISIVMIEICFSFCHLTSHEHIFIKGYVNLWVDVRHGEPPFYHVSWQLVQWKWRYKIFSMSRDLTKPSDWRIKWCYEWEHCMVYHNLDKFGGHRYCSTRDMMFLFYHVIKQDHIIQWSEDYNDWIPSK